MHPFAYETRMRSFPAPNIDQIVNKIIIRVCAMCLVISGAPDFFCLLQLDKKRGFVVFKKLFFLIF